DPITTAILAAIAAAASDVVKSSVKDAYNGLKSIIGQKWGPTSAVTKAIGALEADPRSKGQAAVLAEKIEQAGVAEDPDVRLAVAALVAELKKANAGRVTNTTNANTTLTDSNLTSSVLLGGGHYEIGNLIVGAERSARPNANSIQRFEAEVSSCTRKLQYWPQ